MKQNRMWLIPVFILTVCISAMTGYFSAEAKNRRQREPQPAEVQTEEVQPAEPAAVPEETPEQTGIGAEELQMLNRAGLQNISAEGTIYVIGHKSPDSDTVCSAIAYARLLNLLGFPAEARITEPISNETKYILEQAGVPVPEILDSAAGESIFLVDHSEYAQAAEDMEDAYIVGVIDHHGVGTLQTGNPVVYEARPIGAAATIIWLDYMNCGFEIDRTTAYLLLGAILSDTSNLNASTTTDADRRAVPALAELAGVSDTEGMYRTLREMQLSYEGMTDEDIFFSDYKEYEAGGVKFGIGLINSIDEDASRDLAVRMKNIADTVTAKRDADVLYASIGIRENDVKIDYIVPESDTAKQMMEEAFPNYDEYDGTAFIFRTGLGRKTKFVPGFTDYLTAHPHE